jgi:glycosyltransferase involved in cell wall biosynthesis
VSNVLKQSPRVLHVDHSLQAGGAEFALARMLSLPASWDATLIVPQTSDGLGPYEQLPSLGVVSVRRMRPRIRAGTTGSKARAWKSALVDLVWATRIRWSREFRAADIVHANTTHAAVILRMSCVLSRKIFVCSLRDHLTDEALGRPSRTLMVRWVIPRADGLIGNSESTLASALGFSRNGTLRVVIPSPIGIATAKPDDVHTRQIVTKIGMLARIDTWKGQDILIKAFARANLGQHVSLELAGGDSFGREEYLLHLRELARAEGVADRVAFLGHVDDVEPFISGLDICVQASTRPEPLGQNVLQYLALGRPVVATNVGGPSEWIHHEENGLLTAPGDVDELSATLLRLSEDVALRRQLAENACTTSGLVSDYEVMSIHAQLFCDVVSSRERVTKKDAIQG